MQTASTDIPIPVPIAPVKSLDLLREQWATFDRDTQERIKLIAETAVEGRRFSTSFEPIPRFVTENGVKRRKTLPEIAKDYNFRLDDIDWVGHAEHLVRQYAHKQRLDRLDAFVAQIGPCHANSRLETFVAETQEQRENLKAFTDYCDHIAERVKAGVGIVVNGLRLAWARHTCLSGPLGERSAMASRSITSTARV